MLPAIDAHAHVETSVAAKDLLGLDALVLAVTTRAAEWAEASSREDEMTIWGIGIHPLQRAEVEGFSVGAFEDSLAGSLLVGEVGLDRQTLSNKSTAVFDEILSTVAQAPRPVTIHSSGAEGDVLDALARTPIKAPILHWWRGGTAETEAAIDLGCYFSLNGAQAENRRLLESIPLNLILTETDYPHSRKRDRYASRPAAVKTIEDALMTQWKVSRLELRRHLWRNVVAIFDRCGLLEDLSPAVQETILTVGFD